MLLPADGLRGKGMGAEGEEGRVGEAGAHTSSSLSLSLSLSGQPAGHALHAAPAPGPRGPRRGAGGAAPSDGADAGLAWICPGCHLPDLPAPGEKEEGKGGRGCLPLAWVYPLLPLPPSSRPSLAVRAANNGQPKAPSPPMPTTQVPELAAAEVSSALLSNLLEMMGYWRDMASAPDPIFAPIFLPFLFLRD